MNKKNIIISAVSLAVILFLSTGNLLFAQKRELGLMPKDQVDKMVSLTGLTESQVKTTGLKLDELLMAYSISKKTGNGLQGIIEVIKRSWKEKKNSENVYWKDVYDKYSVQEDKLNEINAEYNGLRAEVFKEKFAKADYGTMDKDKVAEIIAKVTGTAKSNVLEYGFGGGLSVRDMLMACEIAGQTGNSLSDIVRYRTEGGTDFSSVYKKYSIMYEKQQGIQARFDSHLEEVLRAANTEKRQKQWFTTQMRKNSEAIASVTRLDKEKIMSYYRQGFSEGDIIRACAVASKTGADIYDVMKIFEEGGWSKVSVYYNLTQTSTNDEINIIVNSIYNKVNPPPK